MKIEIRNPKSEIRGTASHAERTSFGHEPRMLQHGFTLLEVLLALIVLGAVMVAVHSVFYGALQLRNKADQVFSDAIPLQHTLAMIKRDVANVAIPGGTLSGTLQTSPTTDSSSDISHSGEQCGPTFYTASGTLSDFEPWSGMRKVTYFLTPSTNDLPGRNLIRSVTRNLLPVAQEEYTDQTLMSGVDRLEFEFYNGTQWVQDWDSTTASSTSSTQSNSLPQAVRLQLTLVNADGIIARNPVEMVVPIIVQAPTNTAVSTGGGG